MTLRSSKPSSGKTVTIVVSLFLVLFGTPARAHRHHTHHAAPPSGPPQGHYSWEGIGTDLSVISVRPYLVPPQDPLNPKQAGFIRRMNLENGLTVSGTHWISRQDVRSRDLFILDITQSLEGGFDSVNLYDRGLLSWGIMQWSARSGSLAQSLIFIKRRLWIGKRKALWDKTFVANGIDVDANGLIVYGKPLRTAADIRLAFRGTLKVGQYDPKLANHWALTFARAGRQPAVAALQVDYAAQVVDAVLYKRLTGLPYHAPGRAGLTAADLTANDPYSEALVFALWTNNPRHAFQYVREGASDARGASVSDDPSLWAPGAFSAALLRRCQQSHFGNWARRASLIQSRAQSVQTAAASSLTPFEVQYKSVLATRTARREREMASRHRFGAAGSVKPAKS